MSSKKRACPLAVASTTVRIEMHFIEQFKEELLSQNKDQRWNLSRQLSRLLRDHLTYNELPLVLLEALETERKRLGLARREFVSELFLQAAQKLLNRPRPQ